MPSGSTALAFLDKNLVSQKGMPLLKVTPGVRSHHPTGRMDCGRTIFCRTLVQGACLRRSPGVRSHLSGQACWQGGSRQAGCPQARMRFGAPCGCVELHHPPVAPDWLLSCSSLLPSLKAAPTLHVTNIANMMLVTGKGNGVEKDERRTHGDVAACKNSGQAQT